MADKGGDPVVTLAVLDNEMKHIREDIQDLRSDVTKWGDQVAQVARDHTSRIATLEQLEAVDQERWVAHRAEHQRQIGIQAVISAIASIIAAVVGVFAPRVSP